MSIRLIATISAMTIATAFTVTAQTPSPQTPNPQTPQTQSPADRQRPTTDTQARANTSEQSVTVTGCLQAEKDVPGRRPSVTERAGIAEDYVLTNVKMAQGAKTSGIGLAPMYQIKGGTVKDDDLKNHLGHQVEVMGRLDTSNPSPTSTGAATANDSNDNLPNLEATSLKMIAQTCAAK